MYLAETRYFSIPLVFYGLAVIPIFIGLYISNPLRFLFTLPTWCLLGLSFWHLDRLDSLPDLSHQFGMLIIITFLQTPVIFQAQHEPIRIEVTPSHRRIYNLTAAYKIYNNPRLVSPPKNPSKTSKLLFFGHRFLRLAIILSLKKSVAKASAPTLATCTIGDFSATRESVIRAIFGGTFSNRQATIRLYVCLVWIFETISNLETVHFLLAVLFVAVLRVDEPHEWPVLFGDAREAYTLRRFWGVFWHRLFSPAAVIWARVLTARIPHLQKSKRFENSLVAFLVFTMSGLAHALVGWRLNHPALWKDMVFFWLNFLAVSLEIGLFSIFSFIYRRCGISKIGIDFLWRLLGYCWVCSFFFWAVPRQVYPKVYESLARMGYR